MWRAREVALRCSRLASDFSLGSTTCKPTSDTREMGSRPEVVPAGFAEPSWAAQPETRIPESHRSVPTPGTCPALCTPCCLQAAPTSVPPPSKGPAYPSLKHPAAGKRPRGAGGCGQGPAELRALGGHGRQDHLGALKPVSEGPGALRLRASLVPEGRGVTECSPGQG